MNPSNPTRNPQELARTFARYVKALVLFVAWGIVGLVSVAGAYLAVRVVLVAVRLVLNALGIHGG
jgi:hypothetical protein